jgi:peptidoglycan/xylan/chitin deacetylase (PgdA/CDA1 family)
MVMSLRARGPVASAARAATVLSRFGATPALMERRLERYEAIAGELGIHPTWPTTACVLERHPRLLKRFAERGVELALHGLVHGDHAALDLRRQRETIGRAVSLFERHGFNPSGFRGPYLRYNPATLDALRELGLRYHSSQAVAFPLQRGEPDPRTASGYALALKLYSALDARRVAVTPRLRDGLVDIPVAVPDDEILLDRLKLGEPARAAEWLHILDITYRRGELFTAQLHPERIEELGEALRATLASARGRRPEVYLAQLEEIAAWWRRRSRFSLRVTRMGEGRYCVRLDADADATFLVRGLPIAHTPWYGRDALSQSREFEAEGTRLPVVSVSPSSPAGVASFLAEEGFPVETSDAAAAYGAHVNVKGADWSEAEVLETIEAAPGPLVRIWRWPRGARSALAVTGDVDALTLRDFVVRSWETRDWVIAGSPRP